MKQHELAEIMRVQELRRRALRRSKLLANEAALAEEIVPPEVQAMDQRHSQIIQQQQLAYEKALTPSYWRRLWNALLNR